MIGMTASTLLASVLAFALPPTANADDADQQYQKLVDGYGADRTAWLERRSAAAATDEYKKARSERDMDAINAIMGEVEAVDTAAWVERFSAGAKQHKGTEGAVYFLNWLAANAPDAETKGKAAKRLIKQHVASDRVMDFAKLLWRLPLEDGLHTQICDVLAAKAINPEIRAWATYGKAQKLLRNREATDEDKAAAQKLLAQVVKIAPGSLVAMKADGPRFEKEQLQIGMAAPDIRGEDIDGTKFNLSDYRGKVVVIDFWGDW